MSSPRPERRRHGRGGRGRPAAPAGQRGDRAQLLVSPDALAFCFDVVAAGRCGRRRARHRPAAGRALISRAWNWRRSPDVRTLRMRERRGPLIDLATGRETPLAAATPPATATATATPTAMTTRTIMPRARSCHDAAGVIASHCPAPGRWSSSTAHSGQERRAGGAEPRLARRARDPGDEPDERARRGQDDAAGAHHRRLNGSTALSVIEGDQASVNDAERSGPPAPGRPGQYRHRLPPRRRDGRARGCGAEARVRALVIIENVGNLVCPALFDLGERRRVAMLSVTEGEDKPIKYPHMFRAADLVLLEQDRPAAARRLRHRAGARQCAQVAPHIAALPYRPGRAKVWGRGTNGSRASALALPGPASLPWSPLTDGDG